MVSALSSPAQVIARNLPSNELQGIKEMFKAIDEDNSGCITVDELREGLRKKGAELALSEVRVEGAGARQVA